MKKIFVIFTFLILLVVAGCKKDPIETKPDATIDVVGKVEIKSGETTSLTAKVANVSGLKLTVTPPLYKNGKEVTIIDLIANEDITFLTDTLTETTTFLFRVSNGEKVVASKSITVFVEVVHLTIFLTATPDTLPPIGGQVKINFTTTGATKVLWKEASYGPSGYIEARITETTTFVFTAIGPKGEVTDSITVFVPIPTKEDTLCNFGPWKKVKLEFQDEFGSWNEASIWQCMQDDLLTFNLTKKWVYDNGENRCGSEPASTSGDWFIEGSILNTGSPREIITLSKDTLFWKFNSGTNVRETYVHPAL